MSPEAVRVRLAYRPTGDVLTGRSDLSHPDFISAAETDDVIDSDTTVGWSVPITGEFEGVAVLRSFSMVGARSRFSTHRPDFIPPALWRTASTLFATSVPLGTPIEVAARTKSEAVRSVAISDLRRPESCRTAALAAVGESRSLASASRRLSRAIDAALDAALGDSEPTQSPPRRFARDLYVFGSLTAAHRRPVPSAVDGLLKNLRGGLPFTERERNKVRQALQRTLDVGEWRTVSNDFMEMAEALGEKGPSDSHDRETDSE